MRIVTLRNIRKHCPAAAKRLAGLCIVLAAIINPAAADDSIALITDLQGVLSVQHVDGAQALLGQNSVVFEHDVLSTEADSYARLKFADDSEVVLRPASSLKIEAFSYPQQQAAQGHILLQLLKGGLRKITGMIGHAVPEQDKLLSPVATIGIRGTHYGILYCQADCGQIPTVDGEPLRDGLHIDVAAGAISIQNNGGELPVTAGQFAFVSDQDHTPALQPTEQGLQITIPPVFMQHSDHGNTQDGNHHNGQCTIQ